MAAKETPPTVAYLQALRLRQLGQDAGDVKALEREARAANEATVRAKPAPIVRKSARLHFTSYALRRMQQRGLTKGAVFSIYLHGEGERDRRRTDRTRYQITEKSLALVDQHKAKKLRPLVGLVVVVASPNEQGSDPAVITVFPLRESER